MALDLDPPPPRLVARFAVGMLAAFLLTGLGVVVVMIRTVTDRATSSATFHAEFAAEVVLAPALGNGDLLEPLSGARLEAMDAIVHERILSDGRDVRVKIWAPDGTVLYSDFRSLIGRTFPEERAELQEVLDGIPHSDVSDLSADENIGEHLVADKLLQTYVPLRLTPDGPVVAIAEVYQDYSAVQAEIDTLVRGLAWTLVAGLVLLFAALLPIALRASRALRRQNDRLREQAEQLNVLLAREQRTVAELRDLDQRKSDFVSMASHELRTPLTAILGSVGMLRRPEIADDPRTLAEFVDAVEKHAQRLLRLIKSLLTSARLEEPEGSNLALVRIDLGRVVESAARQLRLEDRCRIRVAEEVATFVTDGDRVYEILIELLDNASKYSPAGGLVDVSATGIAGGVVLSVRDEGVGIDAEQCAHIFERFYQADQSSTRRFGGLGLGLALVGGLVRELGGQIAVDSEPGVGSTFTVTLPDASRELTEPALGAADERRMRSSAREPARLGAGEAPPAQAR